MGHEEFSRRVQGIRQRLYRTAYLYLGNEADAMEAVDEAVYQGLRGLKKLREPQYFETWITRILINECKKELRRRRRFVFTEELEESAAPEMLDHLPLQEAIAHLPEELRSVVILRCFAGYTQAVTRRKGLPPSDTSTRQRRHAPISLISLR